MRSRCGRSALDLPASGHKAAAATAPPAVTLPVAVTRFAKSRRRSSRTLADSLRHDFSSARASRETLRPAPTSKPNCVSFFAGHTVLDCAGASPCDQLDETAPVLARGRLRQSHCGGSVGPVRLRQQNCARLIAPEIAVTFIRGPAALAKSRQDPVLAQVSTRRHWQHAASNDALAAGDCRRGLPQDCGHTLAQGARSTEPA